MSMFGGLLKGRMVIPLGIDRFSLPVPPGVMSYYKPPVEMSVTGVDTVEFVSTGQSIPYHLDKENTKFEVREVFEAIHYGASR